MQMNSYKFNILYNAKECKDDFGRHMDYCCPKTNRHVKISCEDIDIAKVGRFVDRLFKGMCKECNLNCERD
jgi:hypothetical protein